MCPLDGFRSGAGLEELNCGSGVSFSDENGNGEEGIDPKLGCSEERILAVLPWEDGCVFSGDESGWEWEWACEWPWECPAC